MFQICVITAHVLMEESALLHPSQGIRAPVLLDSQESIVKLQVKLHKVLFFFISFFFLFQIQPLQLFSNRRHCKGEYVENDLKDQVLIYSYSFVFSPAIRQL